EAMAGTVSGLRDSLHDEELVRAKRIIEARVVKRLESMEGQANYLAEWAALGDWKLGEQYLADIERLTAADIVDAASHYLRLDAAAVFAYRPAAAPPLGWSAERLGGYLHTTQVLKTVSPLAPSMLATRNGTQAKLDRIEDDVHVFQADSGTQIVVKPRRSAPLVSVALTVAGGANLESGSTAGFTSLLARTSLKGTRSRSAAQLALAAEALGSSLVPTVTADVLDWYISVPSRQFEAALDLVLDVALQPSLPGDELELEKKFALADLLEVRDDMYRYPLRLMLQAGFGGHAYGFSIAEVEQAVAAATADQVRSWHDSIVTRNRPSVFVVGDVDPDVVARQVASRLPALIGQASAPRAPEWPASPIRIIEPRDKRQTALALAFPAVDRNHPDLYALQLLANTIAGLGGRLFEELRSRRSLAYTVTAYPIARGLGGAFVGYIATSPEREDEARNGLLGELERVREERLPPAELERAREYTIGSWQIRAQTNGVQLSDLANALLIGRGLLEIREFEERVRAVTAEDIRNAAQRYFDTGRLVEAIVRGSGGGR
ncbi:MAG TPA: insulinase family protein, partial [Longimicrobiales bacterium]|nr:insulinase family protein [Longimicrobiales bacterium]